MWVSILQNGRKRDKENSVDKISQLLKLTDKSLSTATLIKPSMLGASSYLDIRPNTKQKQNQGSLGNRVPFKSRNHVSAINIKNNVMGSYLSNISDGEPSKKSVIKTVQEQSYSILKQKRSNEVLLTEKQKQQPQQVQEKDEKKSTYFLRILLKKNKLRSQFNIYIYNSIYTFKQFMRSCQLANPKSPDSRIPPQNENRKTIIFDMDETLIHTNEVATPNFEIKVPFRSYQGRVGYGFVEVRPHCKEMLKRLSQHFDIIVFTASTQAYADPILDHIDPKRVIQYRLYRQSCSLIKNQVFVKDLRILGRKLSNVVLVDNAPYSYMMQLENGIPIIPYYRGKDDQELLYLQDYLMKLKDVEDVRTINKDYFKLHQYMKYDTHERLVNKLYGQWLK